MRFQHASAPIINSTNSVARVMRTVLLALVPGIVCLWWFFGFGILINILICVTTAVTAEALILKQRNLDISTHLSDTSIIVTAVLLAVALPPFAPWWVAVIGTLSAVAIGKHVYGGLGLNPFNPAMVGYVVLIISFPREMTLWPPPTSPFDQTPGLIDSLRLVFTGVPASGSTLDAITMATPLDQTRTLLGLNQTLGEIQQGSHLFGRYSGVGWEQVNLWFMVGGCWLLYKKIIRWQIPLGMLAGLFIMAGIFNTFDPDAYPDPLFHLFGGASMIGAFFIATDPVSAATTPRGRLFYGIGIGVLVYIIRTWGGYPDAVAFSVLLMNMAAPAIDHYTRPSAFGHGESQ